MISSIFMSIFSASPRHEHLGSTQKITSHASGFHKKKFPLGISVPFMLSCELNTGCGHPGCTSTEADRRVVWHQRRKRLTSWLMSARKIATYTRMAGSRLAFPCYWKTEIWLKKRLTTLSRSAWKKAMQIQIAWSSYRLHVNGKQKFDFMFPCLWRRSWGRECVSSIMFRRNGYLILSGKVKMPEGA